jgi:hypothetical protein
MSLLSYDLAIRWDAFLSSAASGAGDINTSIGVGAAMKPTPNIIRDQVL